MNQSSINVSNFSDCSFDLPENCYLLLIVRRIFSALSLISLIILISIILFLQRYKILTHRLFLYLIFSLSARNLLGLIGGIHLTGISCITEAFFLQLFTCMILTISAIIGFNLFWNIILLRHTPRCFEFFYIGFIMIFPLIFSLIPLLAGAYGSVGIYCAILSSFSSVLYSTFYGPLYFLVITLLITYLIILIKLFLYLKFDLKFSPISQYQNKSDIKRDISVLILYPFIFLTICIIPIARHAQKTIAPGLILFWLEILHTLTIPIFSILALFIFFLNRNTLSQLKLSNIKFILKERLMIFRNLRERLIFRKIKFENFQLEEMSDNSADCIIYD